jgi:hypothetical protein
MHNIKVARPIQHLGYIKLKYPEIFNEADQVVKQKHLKDWSLVKPIYELMYETTENPAEQRHFFLAVLVELFYPTRRTCGVKFKPGLRDVISEAMGYKNPEMVNYVGEPIEAHMKNPRFCNRVKETAEYFLNEYQ